MQTRISGQFLKTTQGREADRILRACVHCGFCTATCPTYQPVSYTHLTLPTTGSLCGCRGGGGGG